MSDHKQPVYPQQHTAWRPDYPQLWNLKFSGRVMDITKPERGITMQKNLKAFNTARNAIDKAMKS